MKFILLLFAISIIIFACASLHHLSSKAGVPVLLSFIVLGIIAGCFHENLHFIDSTLIEYICTFALIFIMFYGGFDTNWKAVKPIALEAGLLASFGVFITTGITTMFCHFILHWNWLESFLLGTIVSSTDAASVFSILKTKNLGLKNYSTQILSVESGSNDPCSYTLTLIAISLLQGTTSGGAIAWQFFAQIVFAVLISIAIGQLASYLLNKYPISVVGHDSLVMFAIALFSYTLPTLIGGNGFLCVYIVGIIIGNKYHGKKKQMVGFFDGLTSLMQIILFFLLGYLLAPETILDVFLPALAIFGCLTIISRPVAVSCILFPFRKYPAKQIGFISFSGLRGAASIVFAIMTLQLDTILEHNIFSIVFCIVLISILLQSSFLAQMAKFFDMVDDNENSIQTFAEFAEKSPMNVSSINIDDQSFWVGKMILDMHLPKNMLPILLFRGSEFFVPKRHTVLEAGDKLVLCSLAYERASNEKFNFKEHVVTPDSIWVGKRIKDYPYRQNSMVVMIKRGDEIIVPDGYTIFEKGDVLTIFKPEV